MWGIIVGIKPQPGNCFAQNTGHICPSDRTSIGMHKEIFFSLWPDIKVVPQSANRTISRPICLNLDGWHAYALKVLNATEYAPGCGL